MDLAAANGHLPVLQWLHEHRAEGCTADAFHFAVIYGHLLVLQWLHEAELTATCCDVEVAAEAVELAAEHGQLEVLEWLLDAGYLGQDAVAAREVLQRALTLAAANGHAELLDYLHRRGEPVNVRTTTEVA